MNQLDLVDVELPSGSTRGTTWFTLFSPENALFDLRLKSTFGTQAKTKPSNDRAGEGEENSSRTYPLLAWFGLPGAGLGGLNSKTVNPPLFDQPYTIDPARGTIDGVPLSVWSSRSFIARWQATGGGIEAELTATRSSKSSSTRQRHESIRNAANGLCRSLRKPCLSNRINCGRAIKIAR